MKHFKNIVFLFTVLVTFISNAQISVVHLTCEMAENPVAVIQTQPRLSWQLLSKENNTSQIAYQILVASSEEKLKKNEGDVWDSRRVNSAQNLQIVFGGSPLKNETKYFWKVKVWDQNFKVSQWSKTATFRIAPLESALNPIWIGAITKADSHLPEGRNYHTATFNREKRMPLSMHQILYRAEV